MLPFENRPWAKPVAATMITVTLLAAILLPLVLHIRGVLDLPMVVIAVLLVLAIVPPNIVVLRYRGDIERSNGVPVLKSRHAR